MGINKRLIGAGAIASSQFTPSEHFGVMLYEGNGGTNNVNGGKFGGAAHFNGSNSKIDLNNLGLGGAAERTISAWVNVSSLSGAITIYQHGAASNGQRFGFAIDTAGKVYVEYYNRDTITSASHISVNTWYHLAVTYNGGVIETATNTQIYVNGSAVSMSTTGSQTGAANTSDSNYGIGYRRDSNSQYFNGKIDQLRIFNKSLSSSEITSLYNETAATVESLSPLGNETVDTLQVLGDTSCLALYKFENNEDDVSGNYNGTGTEIQYAAGRYGQAAQFNGSSKVDITGFANFLSTGVSISAWVNVDSFSNGPTVVNLYSNNSIVFGTNSSGNFFRSGQGTTVTSNTAMTTGTWNHIVMAADTSGDVNLYLNGNAVGSGSCGTGMYNDNNNNDLIGAYGTLDQPMNGRIDQVRIFNKQISASEVTTLYQENSLVASYRFEGNSSDDTRNNNGSDSNMSYEFGLSFKPDFVWLKNRSQGNYDHRLFDSSRGATKLIRPNATTAEQTNTNSLTSFDTGGFTLGSDNYVNNSGDDFVAWCFKANGGTTSSNSDGSITSTVQANTDAGFSIVQYTGNATSNQTIGHGLGAAPEIIFIKSTTDGTVGWLVFAETIGNTKYFVLNTNAAAASATAAWQDTSPTASVFTIGTASFANNSGESYIAYCFTPKTGFSKFGTYEGNGSATGPIVETGFEPAFLIVKRQDNAGSWAIIDNKRTPTNPRNLELFANLNDADNSFTAVDFLSNGFQIINSSNTYNASGDTFTYIAIAADPDTEAPTLAKSFTTRTYTGTGNDPLVIDGLNLKPGLVWIKSRDQAREHILCDIVRGPNKELSSNDTSAEESRGVKSFDNDGFTLDNATHNYNNNGEDYISWVWAADDNEPTILPNTELSSLISKYKFEDNANDDYGDNNGTASNLSYVSGRYGAKAADFNGSSSKILYPQAAPFNDSNTILAVSAWVKLDSASDEFVIMSASSTSDQADYMMLTVGGNRPGRIFMTDAPSNANEYQANFGSGNDTNWNHYVWQLSASGGIELWYNGTKQTRTQTFQAGSLDETSWFGNLTYATSVQFATGINRVVTSAYSNGSIDQMRLFNAELTSSEISSLYNEANEALVSANANAGFSIVKYQGNSEDSQKIPHGLSAAPELIITKAINFTAGWPTQAGGYYGFRLSHDDANDTANGNVFYKNTAPTATVFTVGGSDEVNDNYNYISYCFHSVTGYSKIGSYTGQTSGVTVTTGFRPDFLLIKSTSNVENWAILDTVRGSGKVVNPNRSNAETDSTLNTFTVSDTGFSLPHQDTADAMLNENGYTYIYAAFKIN